MSSRAGMVVIVLAFVAALGCGGSKDPSADPAKAPPPGPEGRVVLEVPPKVEIDATKAAGPVPFKVKRENFEGDVQLHFDFSAAKGVTAGGIDFNFIERENTAKEITLNLEPGSKGGKVKVTGRANLAKHDGHAEFDVIVVEKK